jgi:hypothetical protein
VNILNYHRSGEPDMAQLDVSPIGVGDSQVGFVSAARRIDDTGASAHA